MFSSFYQLDADVRASVARKEHGRALDQIRDFVSAIMNEQSMPGEVVGARKLDLLCEIVGKSFVQTGHWSRDIDKLFKANADRVVIVCTGLYRYGGTSLLISDIVKAHPDAKTTVLATNSLDDMTDDDLKTSRIEDVDCAVEIAKSGTSAMKLEWLIEQLINVGPSRIYILNHHQDSVIISAMEPFVRRTNVLFYHHADYNVCLGVHLQGARHVDPHNVGYFNCRSKELISDNIYVPMMVSDREVNRTGETFLADGTLITCSSGTFHKFRNFYLYPYVDMIANRLKTRNGIHYHIGNMTDQDASVVYNALNRQGVAHDRFVHIRWTKDLWTTAFELKVDLFIASFPIGGARTSIEMMGAGIPHLMPQSYLSRFFSSRDISYPDHYVWKYPTDFSETISAVDADDLKLHSARARAHYLRHYCSETLNIAELLDHACSCRPTPEPYALYEHQPDHLDRALHFAHLEHVAAHHAAQHSLAVGSVPVNPPRAARRTTAAGTSTAGVFGKLRAAFGY